MHQSGIILATFLLGMVLNSNANAQQQGTIAGSVTYLQRVALPANAEIEVKLEDVSKADASGKVLAQTRFASKGAQVPFTFLLTYDRGNVLPGSRYNVRAAIYVDDRLLWTTDTNYPVTLDGTDEAQRLVLKPVQSQPTPTQSLGGVRWKLYELNGQGLVASKANAEPGISFEVAKGDFGANAGLNSMGGKFTLNGTQIKFGQVRMTMMAGPPELMNQERAFAQMLERATNVKRFEDKLVIYSGQTPVAKFNANKG